MTLQKQNIQNIYRLSPMQEGMFFHALLEPDSDHYFEQMSYHLCGCLDIARIKSSLDDLVRRYDILRTVFIQKDDSHPLQVVLKERLCDFTFHDLSSLPDPEERVRQFLVSDRRNHFDLGKDNLMRVTVLQVGVEDYEFVWSHHHILMDGWCLGVLISEFLELYAAHCQGRPARLATVTPYRTYIDWLQRLDREESRRFWETMLAGYEQPAKAPVVTRRPNQGNYQPQCVETGLDQETTERLEKSAAQCGVTLNNVLQVLWGIVVGIYNNSRDVVFGSVVSGRPSQLPGIERMVGLCINTVPVRVRWERETLLADLLRLFQRQAVAAEAHHYIQLVEIQNCSAVKQQLVDHIFVFENYPVSAMIDSAGKESGDNQKKQFDFQISRVESFEQTNFDLNVIGVPGPQLRLRLQFNAGSADKEAMQHLLEQYTSLITQAAADLNRPVIEFSLLSEAEYRRVISDFNATETAIRNNRTIHKWFEEKVTVMPQRTALLAADGRPLYTYAEFNNTVNRLARHLHQCGVTRGDRVLVALERSPDMVIAVYAILKTGAAYVPVDPNYPAERIRYILADSGASLVLGRHAQIGSIVGAVPLLDPVDWYLQDDEGTNPNFPCQADDQAYLIYTSGSTGYPKGVVVEHHSVENVLQTLQAYYPLGPDDVYLLKTSFAFDVSVAELFGWFWNGGCLAVAEADDHRNPYRLLDTMEVCGVTHLNFVPSMFNAFLSILDEYNARKLVRLRYLMLAGEALTGKPVEIFHRFAPHVQVENIYGPTESTIYAARFSLTCGAGDGVVPIGRPLHNIFTYILDDSGRPLPVRVPGELYLSGAGVARGYLNQPELTAHSFLPDPFRPGLRMYRTGDLARWLSNGTLEFLGRLDSQVKIRGFRIELDEITAVLRSHAAVQQAVTIVKTSNSTQRLLAYVTLVTPVEEVELQSHLAERLPEYMIPGRVVVLDQFPLSAVGKIDLQALPIPEENATGFTAPRNAMECRLKEIWTAVLGVDAISIDANFFQIGGDSIKAIQIVSRLRMIGLKLEVRDIFQFPTVAGQAAQVRKLQHVYDQRPVIGDVLLSPIQQGFFMSQRIDSNHFNQAVLLHFSQRLNEDMLRRVFNTIQSHHDVLRSVFRYCDGEWRQTVLPPEGFPLDLQVFDFTAVADPYAELNVQTAVLQGSIDLSGGPLMKLGLFHLPDADRLLIVVHHLVIDGFSWRILFEDIDTLVRQYENDEALHLPSKTLSFQEWGKRLHAFATSSAMGKEVEYWKHLSAVPTSAPPVDFPQGTNLMGDGQSITLYLTTNETEQLLTRTHHAFRTETNDILLTALSLGALRAFGMTRMAIALEGHGREEFADELDVSRTVGWFTTEYPVVLNVEAGGNITRNIVAVKEHLHRIPNKGIGYGVCKYLVPEERRITTVKLPVISFNFMGQFDTDIQERCFRMATESTGPMVSGRQENPYEIMISGMIAGGRLSLQAIFSRQRYRAETIRMWLENTLSALREIITTCASRTGSLATPCDFTYRDLSLSELERLQNQLPGVIQDLFPLTPMQEGMLFHALLDDSSGAYCIQHSYRLRGDLQPEFVPAALAVLFQRYEVLRSMILHEGLEQPLQVVLAERPIEIAVEDVSALVDAEAYIRDFKTRDRSRSFRLDRDVLLRVAIFRVNKTEWEFILSFHHILMDGWCSAQLTGEFMLLFHGLQLGRTPELPPANPHRLYIEWLQRRQPEEAQEYWSSLLEGYTQVASLADFAHHGKRREGYQQDRLVITLTASETVQLQRLAASHSVTLNILIQVVWGITLGRYCQRRDVVFGVVVSGRPAEIPGVEQMVGLFINTIPVRIRYERSATFADVLQSVQTQALQSEPHHYYPLARIHAESCLKNNLFDHIFVFENYPLADHAVSVFGKHAVEGSYLQVVKVDSVEQSNYNLSLLVIPGEQLTIELKFNAQVYDREMLALTAAWLHELCRRLASAKNPILADLEALSADEHWRVLETFNDTTITKAEQNAQKFASNIATVPLSPFRTVIEWFGKTAASWPERTALVGVDGCQLLSYAAFAKEVSRLAGFLIEHGVQRGDYVAIILERSSHMIVAIFAILSAGAAYVPIDPEYPLERVQYILRDCGTRVVLGHRSLAGKVAGTGALLLDPDDWPTFDDTEFSCQKIAEPNDAAYVIYTSGSTGRPKGVVIEHHSLISLIEAQSAEFGITSEDRIMQFSTYTFDASVEQIFLALCNGATLVLTDRSTILDPQRFEQQVAELGVTHLNAVPAFLATLHFKEKYALRRILAGGDVCPPELARKWAHLCDFYNKYGPTETTVVAVEWRCREVPDDLLTRIPIGRPLPYIRAYILDDTDQPLPVGVAGELFLSGAGVARGYMNQPELTAHSFLPDPFKPGLRMYRTGDLARWLPDGNLEFLGRHDFQVKIRGFRIELGEIRSRLLEHPKITDSIVALRQRDKEENGTQHLVGYYIAEQKIPNEELREFLGRMLPEYMIPVYFVHLDQIPLTAIGKLDRDALPDPSEWSVDELQMQLPANALEEQLLDIWRSVLGHDDIGTHHNFFIAGGDSIKAIQILSRLNRFGYKAEMRELFQFPTVADLAPRLRRLQRQADQSVVHGDVPLTPIQHVFFNTKRAQPYHYNHAVIFHSTAPLSEEAVRAVFGTLQHHHDMLRACCRLDDYGGRMVVQDMPLALQVYDWRGEADVDKLFREEVYKIQSSIDLSTGPLMKLGLFKRDDGDRLLWVIHHLVVDGVSWRILLEDVETLLLQFESGKPLQLPPKTDSFQRWAKGLVEYATSQALLREIEYWSEIARRVSVTLPLNGPVEINFSRDEESLVFHLSEAETADLMGPAHQSFGTEVNDLLLGALALAAGEVFGWSDVLFYLEGHGREEILDDINVNRTVGWFTSEFPLILSVPAEARSGGLSRFIRETKETLRRIPHKGIGYGILRYLTPSEYKAGMPEMSAEGISFNYLGQFDTGSTTSPRLLVSREGVGSEVGVDDIREHELTVIGSVAGKRLTMAIAFNRRHMDRSFIEALSAAYQLYLRQLMAFCLKQEKKVLSPSDLTYNELSIEDMDAIDSLFTNS